MQRVFTLLKPYTNDYILNNVKLKGVNLIKSTGELTFHFEAEKPVEIKELREFLEQIDSHLAQNIREQYYDFEFKTYDENDIKNYYRYIIQRITKNSPKLITSINYEVNCEGNKITIKAPSTDKTFIMNRKAILDEYRKLGFNNVEVNIEVEEVDDNIADIIRKEQNQLVSDTMKEMNITPDNTWEQLFPEREIYGEDLALNLVPDDEEGYMLFSSTQRKPNYKITGYVAFFDAETFEKKSIVKFIVYDGLSYVYCSKRRLSSKEEARYFARIKVGMTVVVQCYPEFNNYTKDVSMHIINMKYSNDIRPVTTRTDDEPVKRVELHAHTKMSALDGVPDMTDYIKAAKIFGHRAIAVTDHNSVQSYHDLHEQKDIKPIYGLELSYVDEEKVRIAYNPQDIGLADATYVVFDLETTGFSVTYERIIEISAYKVKNGLVIEEFERLVNPEKQIPPSVVALTGITNKDVETAPNRKEVLTEFRDFIEGCILVGHNASFDVGHMYRNFKDLNIDHYNYPTIDTLILAKVLNPNHRSYGLDALCKRYGVKLDNHHRAGDDAKATEEIFLHMMEEVKEKGITNHKDLNSMVLSTEAFKYPIPKHINVIAKTQKGLINLYHLLSIAGTEYCTFEPVLTKKILEKYRDGILVSTGCRNSDFFRTAFEKDDSELEAMIDFYDFIEVQPQNTFEYYQNHMNNHVYCYQDTVKRIIAMAKKHGIPVCATGDCHQINKDDLLYRNILVHTDPVGGERKHYLSREKEIPAEYYMTTREMLDQFSFLGEELAYEIVVTNTNLIADTCEDVKSFSKTPYPPKDDFMKKRGIPSAEGYVYDTVYGRAKKLYGDPLPGPVLDRIHNELDNIMANKFSTIYLISQQLVYKSRSDGYVVGSRGSVGSSFVAHLMDITEVNSLPPHYRCPNCHYSTFKMIPEEKEKYGVRKDEEQFVEILDSVTSGYDLPDRNCPVCGTLFERDGHDIPFETFLGVPQDPKTPDIDLNFSGENQKQIHNHIRELFGETKAFRAGTILTCKDKTAYAVVRDYFDEVNEARVKEGLEPEHHKKAEIEALSEKINGAKKTSSQHPGGIVVVPEDHEIYEVTPVQYPGDSKDRSWMTTHFDYHTFEKNLFKLDVLGHDDPTVIKYLMKFVKDRPERFPFDDALNIPVNDPKVYQMMNDTKVLGIEPDDIGSSVATYGISEFGTTFVRGLLEEARPHTFAELVKVSGLSHGTDVWNDNAQALLQGKAKNMPKIPFKDVIGCRDDIMLNLIEFGVPADLAFQTMEFVRKGKPSKDEEKWKGFCDKLSNYNVPAWYIWSCTRIKYMFPKAHATAYVIMALRIAWFKVYRPVYFYSAILSKKMTQYDVVTMVNGVAAIRAELDRLRAISAFDRKAKEEDLITTLELALEMTVRGLKFYPIDLYNSLSTEFKVADDESGLYMPYCSIDQMGTIAADSIIAARNEKPFATRVDFRNRTSVSKTIYAKMEDLGVFDGLLEDNQLTLDLGI